MHPARQAYVEACFVSHFEASQVEVRFVEAADWYLYLDAFPQARYGWSFPCGADISEGGVVSRGVVWVVCPQLITKQTERCDSATFRSYIDSILWLTDRYVDHFGEDSFATYPDPIPYYVAGKLLGEFEDELYDLSASALSIYSRVQLAVLDT